MKTDANRIEDYQRDGVVLLRSFFTEERVAEVRAELERYIRDDLPSKPNDARSLEPDGKTVRNLWRLEQHNDYFRELADSELITSAVAELVGGEPVLAAVETFNKPARVGSAVPYHQDNAYFCRTPPDMLTLWIAIDPVTPENGPVYFIKGSHKSGLLPTKPSGVTGNSIGLAEPPAVPKSEQFCATLQPGDATIHHCEIIHHSDPNLTDQPRLGLLFVFRGAHTEVDPKLQAVYSAAQSATPPAIENSRFVQFQNDGFVTVEKLISDSELETLRHRMDMISEGRVPTFPAEMIEFEPVATESSGRPPIRKINQCAERDDVFMAHAADPRILDIIEALIGPDIKLFGSQCFMKPPGGIQKPYHQDSAYFTIEPRELVTCWTALDDATIDNGCLWVVPGSHQIGLLDHDETWHVGDRVDMQVRDEQIDYTREVSNELTAGSCSFHHSMLLHRSGPNQTEKSRRGLAIHYMSSRSRWTHPTNPRPTYPLLRGREYPDCV